MFISFFVEMIEVIILLFIEFLGMYFGVVVNNYCVCIRFLLLWCGCCYDYKFMKELYFGKCYVYFRFFFFEIFILLFESW